MADLRPEKSNIAFSNGSHHSFVLFISGLHEPKESMIGAGVHHRRLRSSLNALVVGSAGSPDRRQRQ